MTDDSAALLIRGLADLGLESDEQQLSRLQSYISLLQKWNKAYNLTTVKTAQGIISQHLLDSLAITSYIEGENLLDVGSGAGLPGIPLAIMLPELRVTMLDSNGKKTRFINQAVLELGLDNARAIHTRVEDYQADTMPDMIVTRAFAPLQRMVKSCGRLLEQDIPLLAMKSTRLDRELEDWPHHNWDVRVHELSIPGIKAERYAVMIRKQS